MALEELWGQKVCSRWWRIVHDWVLYQSPFQRSWLTDQREPRRGQCDRLHGDLGRRLLRKLLTQAVGSASLAADTDRIRQSSEGTSDLPPFTLPATARSFADLTAFSLGLSNTLMVRLHDVLKTSRRRNGWRNRLPLIENNRQSSSMGRWSLKARISDAAE
jgi:hypothetical protein